MNILLIKIMKIPSTKKTNPWPRPDKHLLYLLPLTEIPLRMMVYAHQVALSEA